MNKINYQSKIIGSLAGFLVVVGILFGFGFPWLVEKDTEKLVAILEQKKVVLELRQEQRNIELAKQDLNTLTGKARQPEDFFKEDVALVSRLNNLELEAEKYEVDFEIAVAGPVNTATKAKTASDLFVIPFTMRLTGEYAAIVAYMDFLEHEDTIFSVRSVSLGPSGEGLVTASLVGTFHLKK